MIRKLAQKTMHGIDIEDTREVQPGDSVRIVGVRGKWQVIEVEGWLCVCVRGERVRTVAVNEVR